MADPANLFRSDLSRLTFEDVRAFYDQGLAESVILDYKLEASSNDLVTKAVSALANTQGGLLVFGVRTGPGRLPIALEGMPVEPTFPSRIEKVCIASILPPVFPFVGYVPHPSDSLKAFAVIRVEPSDLAHTVDQGRKLYVRHGDNSIPQPEEATFEERELLRNRRALARRIDQEHADDLKNRVMFDWHPQYPTMLLRILPRFAPENALLGQKLFEIANSFKETPFLGRVLETVSSYSQGVRGSHLDGPTPHDERNHWRLALTSRGALAVANVVRRGKDQQHGPLFVRTLLAWCRMSVEWAEMLAREAGFWGTYDVRFEATGWEGVPLRDSGEETNRFTVCMDDDIVIGEQWSALDLREDAFALAVPFFHRIWWAFGQGNKPTPERLIRNALEGLQRLR